MVKVNGNDEDMAGISIEALIGRLEYEKSRIVVELNEEIVPKAGYEETILKDGDVVEVVSFVGGG